MSILCWNCRGLGNPRVVQFLKDIIGQKKPNIVFLCETLCKKEKVEAVKRAIGFECCFVVDCIGHSDGVAMLWRYQEEASLLSYDISHVDMELNLGGHPKFRFTGSNGDPSRHLRPLSWEKLRNLATSSYLPWVVMGDLNNVLSNRDKKGRRPYSSWLINSFQEVVEECNLIDIDLIGYQFTW